MELVIKLLKEKKEELESIKISPNHEFRVWKEEFIRQINDAIKVLRYIGHINDVNDAIEVLQYEIYTREQDSIEDEERK
jgi:hypothetical protein